MKKIFFSIGFLCLLMKLDSFSQNLKSDLNHLFESLDKTQINTGYLHDKTLWFGNLHRYDGHFDTICNRSNFEQLYSELYNSCVKTHNDLVDFDNLNDKLSYYAEKGLNPLLCLNFSYNTISTNAKENNLIEYNQNTQQLLDVQGRTQSPYDENKAFIFCVAKHSEISMKSKFVLDPSLWFSNFDKSTISSIRIDFDDGNGYRNMRWNDEIEISYQDTGYKELKIELKIYCNNQLSTLIAKTYYQADEFSNLITHYSEHNPWGQGIENDKTKYLKPDILFKLNEESTVKFDALVSYVFGYNPGHEHNLHTEIKKPLLIVEGIDFKTRRESQFDQNFNKCGSNGLGDLLSGKQWNYGNLIKRAQWDIGKDAWKAIEYAPEAIDALRKEGYDIIYVDFINGAQDMEKNAMFVVDIIKLINDKYALEREQDLVILGASMGGQLAKYALSYMEKNKIKHCCRMYVSFDSPHKGANIPISLQLTADYFAGYVPGFKSLRNKLQDNVAVKQLLNNYYESHDFGVDFLRIDWLNKLDKVGNYPSLTRNIAITNGNIEALQFPFASGEKLARFGILNKGLNGKGLKWLQGPFAELFSLSGTNGTDDPSKNNVILKCNARNLKVYEYQVPSNTKSWDNAPGGSRNDLKELSKITVLWNSMAFHENYCFIPVISALDINTDDVNYNVNQNWSINSFFHPMGKSPFEAYYGQNIKNQDHITLEPVNADWLRIELVKNERDLPLSLPTIYNGNALTYYNFASLSNRIIGSITINANGKLQVNGVGDATNFHWGSTSVGNITLDNNAQNKIFQVNTRQCGSSINITKDGILELGAANTQNRGWMNVIDGGIVTISEGGKLIINNGSKLIIKEGSYLVIKNGAQIELNGNDAAIEIEDGGVLYIDHNTTFSFNGNGRIKFTNNTYKGRNIICGKNAKIDLKGSTLITPMMKHVVLEVDGTQPLYIPDNLVEFKIDNATINLGEYSSINIACPIEINHICVTATDQQKFHKGIHTCGQKKININNSYFKYGIYGIYADNVFYGNSIALKNCTFQDCKIAIFTKDKGVKIEGIKFENCNYGLTAIDMSYGSSVKNSKTIGTHYTTGEAINYRGLIGGNLTATGNNFSYNYYSGIRFKGPTLTMRCNTITNNMYPGIYASPITLNMSELYSKNAGRNKITDNQTNIVLPYCANILIENGYNDFSSSNAANHYKSIVGFSNNYYGLMADIHGNIIQTGSIILKSHYNHWDDDLNFNNPDARMIIGSTIPTITQKVVAVDHNPLNSGILQSTEECEPMTYYGNPGIAMPVNGNGITISGALFANRLLHDAISDALVVQNEINDLVQAINMWHDIITHVDYKAATVSEKNLIDLAYGKMLEAIGEAAAEEMIPIIRGEPMPDAFEKVIAAQNYLLQQKQQNNNTDITEINITPTFGLAVSSEIENIEFLNEVNNSEGIEQISIIVNNEDTPPTTPEVLDETQYRRKLELSLHKAFTYRMAEQRTTCLEQLNEIQNWIRVEDLPRLNYYQCVLDKEIKVISGAIDKFALDSIEVCSYVESGSDPMFPKRDKTALANTAPAVDKNAVTVSPNPSHGPTHIALSVAAETTATLALYDLAGKQLRTLLAPHSFAAGVYNIAIDISELPAGIYIVRAQMGDELYQQKLMKE